MGRKKRTKRYLRRIKHHQKKHGYMTRKVIVRLFPKRFKGCYSADDTLKKHWNRVMPGLDRGRLTIPKTNIHLHWCTEGTAHVHQKSYDYMNSVSLDDKYTMAIKGGNQFNQEEIKKRNLSQSQTNIYTDPNGRHVILIANGTTDGSSKIYKMVTVHHGKVCNELSIN